MMFFTIIPKYIYIYINGSRDPISNKSRLSIYIPSKDIQFSLRAHSYLQIHTVEMLVILIALYLAEKNNLQNILTLTDNAIKELAQILR